jgi:hypothetical protein
VRYQYSLGILCLVLVTSAGAKEPDLKMAYKRLLESTAVVVIKGREGDRHQFQPATCLDRDKGLFLTGLYAVKDDSEAAFVFPRYDKAGELVTDPDEYARAATAGPWVKGRDCLVGRDPKRCMAVVKLQIVPLGTRPLALAPAPPKEGEVGLCLLAQPITLSRVLSPCRVQIGGRWEWSGRRKDLGGHEAAVRGWNRDPNGAIGVPGQPFVNMQGELIGIFPDGPALGDKESAAGLEVLDVDEVRAALKDMKVELPAPKANLGPKK